MKISEMKISDKAHAAMVRRQQLCWALKSEMGFSIEGAANDSVQMLGGQPADVVMGLRISAIAAQLSKDAIYLSFKTLYAKDFAQVGVAFRDDLVVDWRSDLQPYAADQDAPLVLVDVQRGGRLQRGERNMLVFREGVPDGLERGRRIAIARVRKAAATMPAKISSETSWVPPEEDPADHLPDQHADICVRVI